DGRGRSGAKRVTFPSDEDIVSGAVEPKDPWRHARNVTVEEIVAAYRQACLKLNCRQIPKLLKQIQEFKDLAPRIDCLDLKGEKLDFRACEAMEEIFKRLQFKLLDLEQTSLDEDGASALFDMIEYYESATHLHIGHNKHLGARGWQAAAHMMRKTSCLQYLDARNTPLLDHSAPFVARALRISSSLVVLHLENTSLSGRPLMLLATALKMNVTLRELYLADNKLNGLQDSAQLGNLLKFNGSLQILDLRNNHILDSGLAYICEGLREQRRGLVTLVLWNNQLSHAGMAFLGMTLPHTQSLETLNLGHNPIGNEGVRNLKNGLIGNRSVLRLGLACTKLTCEGAGSAPGMPGIPGEPREPPSGEGGVGKVGLGLGRVGLGKLGLGRLGLGSFLETQKALLAEIQNGCKRNFVLAKEQEEKEQRLQHSASMAEISGADPEDPEDPKDPGSASPAPEENGNAAAAGDSSSDTEEEEEEEGKGSREAPECGNSGSPGNAERRISVSSPGRGRKIFVVTRVENVPEGSGAVPEGSGIVPDGSGAVPEGSGAVPEGSRVVPEGSGIAEGIPCGSPSRDSATLPNGLQADFARALPEPGPEGEGKPGTRAAEHELSCSRNEQELQELLLEASQDTAPESL
ncbi:PPR37 phosphatase, partial [Lanius ludovicianus]|nr:PPR37 phosphatase [Lanius ludovicianus]